MRSSTPHAVHGVLVLAMLCDWGVGNFSSSMARISFFFPKERKARRSA